MVGFAKQHKLTIHPYTFRVDDLPKWTDSYNAWLTVFIDKVKIDSVFTDFPIETLQVINQHKSAQNTL